MNVLILNPSFRVYGGAELAIVKLAKYLKDKGDSVTIYTLEMSREVKRDLEGINIEVFSSTKDLRNHLHATYDGYEVINSHNHPMELMLYPVNYPHVWFHNEPPEYVLYGRRLTLSEKAIVAKTVDKIVVWSRYNKRRVEELYGMSALIVPFGIDTEFFDKGKADPARAEMKLGLHESDFVVLHPGWFSPFKNQFRTLLAYTELRDKIPNLKVVFPGMTNTDYYKYIARAIKVHSLSGIIIPGFISRELMRDLYARCNVAVFPYREQGGFLSIFEALAMECNVIVSSEAPCIEYIQENSLAKISDNLEEQILRVYNGEFRRTDARSWIVENLTWNRYSSSMRRIYEEVAL